MSISAVSTRWQGREAFGRFLLGFLMVAFAVLLTLGIAPATALAEDVSSTYVTDITADRETANNWGRVTYTVNYDATGKDDIQPGDVISASWPTSGDVYLVGPTESTLDIVLTDRTVLDSSDPHDENNHPIVGQVVISSSGMTATFDENVSKYYNVKGTVTFTVQARNTTEEDQNVTVTSGDKTSTVTVKPSDGSTGVGFAEKYASWETDVTGGEDPEHDNNSDYDHVYWSIRVNHTYASNNTGTVVIDDTLEDGQTFDSLTCAMVYWQDDSGTEIWGNSVFGDANVRDWIVNVLGGTVTTSDSNIHIEIPASSLNSYPGTAATLTGKPVCVMFRFRTNLASHTADEWKLNDALVTHQDTTMSEPVTDTAHSSIQVPNNSSTATGVTPGTLQITKTVGDSDTPLSGVSFKVYKLDDDGNVVSGWYNGADYATVTTADGGIGKITGLRDGTYRVVEDDGPSWVVIDKDTEHDVTLTTTAGGNVDVNDEVQTTNITANKAWSGDASGETHPTIYFQLYRYTGDDASQATAVSGSIKELPNGTTSVTWENMPAYDDSGNEYTYVFKEVDADGNVTVPTGYTSDQPENGTAAGGTITNTRKTTSVSITKTWSDGDDQDGLRPSAEDFAGMVHLYKTVGGETSEVEGAEAAVTDNGDGTYAVSFANLPQYEAGSEVAYTVTEDSVEGYSSDQPEGGVSAGGTITNTHTPGTTSVSITKTWSDGDDQDGLRPSAEDFAGWVELFANGEQVSDAKAEVIDNGDGTYTVTFANLPEKADGQTIDYTVRETIPDGAGYEADNTEVADGGNITNTHTPSTEVPPSQPKTGGKEAVPDTGDSTTALWALVMLSGLCIVGGLRKRIGDR
ncbi:MAG: Cna B-type domain-containing protein [Tractidigestivibacter sp.]|jgi:hypothetical protein|uniref:Cna B-type domain-containing protein n=1 Tax=Tractidigestivibacter sp. TaxID=2847320 RepID=UPI003D8D1A83